MEKGPFETIEQAHEVYLNLTDEINTVKSDLESLKAIAAEKDKRIIELQEANQKLFLRVTNEPEEQDQEDETMTIEDFAKTFLGGK